MKPRVMLDAGHYGKYNRSPAVPDYWESEMTWRLHLALRRELEARGCEVGVTRAAQGEDLPVYRRGALAAGYDAFFSLHSNAAGASVREETDHPVVYRLAGDGEGEALASDLARAVADLMRTREAGRTATRVTSSGGEYYGVLRGAREAGCPHAFIVEHSFHTATAPSRWLLDPANIDALAAREAELIARFLGAAGGGKEDGHPVSDETKKRIAALEQRVAALEEQCRVYHWYSQLPDYARATIERLHKNGTFAGAGPDDMQLTRDMMRILLILANKGII